MPEPATGVDPHELLGVPFDPPERLLLGPGPSNVSPRVLAALSMPTIGHLDPAFIDVMKDVQRLLRHVWKTENALTIPISGTGSAAMEAAVANVVEPGEVIVVGCNGYFGERLVDMSSRYGADVRRIDRPWAEVFEVDELKQALEAHRPAVLALVHAETSTGARQPLAEIGPLCREHDCLLLVDSVTSLGGVELRLDDWGIDVAYSGTQKCLSCPPGLGPLTLGPRAVEKLHRRKSRVANWYLDLTMVGRYWGEERTYHHTAPVNMVYALREALRIVAEEGVEARWARHARHAALLWSGLEELGLVCHVDTAFRLPSLTTVRVPDGVDAKRVSRGLLEHFGIEVAGGLGRLAGRVWRVGLMGHNSREANVYRLLDAFRRELGGEG